MNKIFADTSALIALKDASDHHHPEALEHFQSLRRRPKIRFLITNYVLSETHAYFCRNPSVALEYVEHLLSHPQFQVVRAGGRDERRAVGILRSSPDKTYSFADAVSFAVMERLGVRSVFAFDRHFKQYGRHQVFP